MGMGSKQLQILLSQKTLVSQSTSELSLTSALTRRAGVQFAATRFELGASFP